MDFTLTPIEARILGCLIEKEATTPDVYPLTLNSLQTACNQKSNREPVMEIGSDDLLAALDDLIDKTLVSTWKSGRNRAAKYQHKLHHRVLDKFDFSLPELAVLCVLFLRGPQTPGEIRSRCARINEFDSLDAVDEVLTALAENPDGPYVAVLPRQAGRKESRYVHLFCGTPDEATPSAGAVGSGDGRSGIARSAGPVGSGDGSLGIEGLEREVSELKSELRDLQRRFDQFTKQFE